MTTAEYQAGLERLATARAALQPFEDLAAELAAHPLAAPNRTLLLCAKESLHATRLVVMEVAERCAGPREGNKKQPAAGWGGSGFVP